MFDEQQRRDALREFFRRNPTLKVSRVEKNARPKMGDGTLRKFLDGTTHTLTDRTYQQAAASVSELLGRPVQVGEMQGHAPEQMSFLPASRSASSARGMAEPPAPRPAPDLADIPVWASAAAGDGEGAMILTDTPIDFIRRSERMLTVRNPWAFHIVGDSMLERLAQGDQVVINPAMQLLPGTDCVFVHQAEDGSLYALVKRLLRANADVWRVRQFNPAKDFELSRKKWSKAYRIAEIRPRM